MRMYQRIAAAGFIVCVVGLPGVAARAQAPASTQPSSPSAAPGPSSLTSPSAFSLVSTIRARADLVELHEGRVYVVDGKTLTIFDLSNAAAPVRQGAYTFPEKIWGIRVVGGRVFVAADFFGLGILDVSRPDALSLIGSLKTPGQAKNVAVVGSTALVADHMTGVDIIDVSIVSAPAKRGSFFLEGYARDVMAAGSFAYAIDAPAGLYVFDLSSTDKLDSLEPVGSDQSATAPGSIELVTKPTDGAASTAVLVGGGALQVYDVSNPKSPRKVTAFRTPSGRPTRAALKASTAYVADGREGLQVVDLSTPAAPRLIGSYPTAQPARDVAVAGPLIALSVGPPEAGGEVLILHEGP